jgi:hypothetical protein
LEVSLLQRGDRVSHFVVTTLDGSRAAYDEIWQRRSMDEILEWLRYIDHECPQCQGEAR